MYYRHVTALSSGRCDISAAAFYEVTGNNNVLCRLKFGVDAPMIVRNSADIGFQREREIINE